MTHMTGNPGILYSRYLRWVIANIENQLVVMLIILGHIAGPVGWMQLSTEKQGLYLSMYFLVYFATDIYNILIRNSFILNLICSKFIRDVLFSVF